MARIMGQTIQEGSLEEKTTTVGIVRRAAQGVRSVQGNRRAKCL